jgi:DNA-binding SARP family transcriptional activator/Flp pilus assembly protein TadD/TolB-like protein
MRLIGEFRLFAPDGRPLVLASRRARALLGYLALAPRHSATRARLRGLLWSDRGEAQARASLRQCILAIRNALDAVGLDLMNVSHERVELAVGRLETDVDELRAALARGDIDVVREGLEMMGEGQLLESLEIGGLFREWLEQSRARMDQVIAADVLGLIAGLESRGQWRGAQALAQAYLARDALDEAVNAAVHRAEAALAGPAPPIEGAGGGAASGAAALASDTDWPPSSSPEGRQGSRRLLDAQGPPVVTIAAFGAMGEPGGEGPLATVLRDEVISNLSRFQEFRVVTDRRTLDAVVADAPEREMDTYALGASLNAGPGQRRVNVRLLRGGERQVIWSRGFFLPEPGASGTVDDIVGRITAAVLPSIHADLIRRARDMPAGESYERFLLTFGPDAKPPGFEEARAAAATLEAMVAANATFAAPYLPLAFLYNTDFGHTRAGSSGERERARAFDLAKTALALDRVNAHAYTAVGWSYLRRRQWEPARLHFQQALALNPYHVRRLMEAGYGHIFLGDLDTARVLLDRCLSLTPSPRDGFFTDLGLIAMIRGDYDQAESYFELAAEPEIWGSVFGVMNAELAGRPARETVEAAMARIGAIWPPDRPLTGESIVAWLASHHPFRSQEVETRFLGAARRAFRDF